jgi:hypothetical protein
MDRLCMAACNILQKMGPDGGGGAAAPGLPPSPLTSPGQLLSGPGPLSCLYSAQFGCLDGPLLVSLA